MKCLLQRMLDETEFLSDYGVRAVSRYHRDHPYVFAMDGESFTIDYEPGESTSGMFGGNSNWRGPVWFPINYLIVESLQKFHHYYGDEFKIECPTGSGRLITILEVAEELDARLSRVFLRGNRSGPPRRVWDLREISNRRAFPRTTASHSTSISMATRWRRRRRLTSNRLDRADCQVAATPRVRDHSKLSSSPNRLAVPSSPRSTNHESSAGADQGCHDAKARHAEDLFRGKKALVTGANSGIGKAVAIGLGQAGADVVVNYVTHPETAQEVVQEIERAGSRAIAVQADVSKEDQVVGMFKKMIQELGTIDILVSNAGLQRDAALTAMTVDMWNTVIGVNLTGQFLCCREAVREFLRRGVRNEVSCAAGKIICMSSVHQIIPWSGHVDYASSKGGIGMMMQSIAQEVAPHRIRVNSIGPGAIRTPINKPGLGHARRRLEKLPLELIPYKRIGEPEDIARAAVWLASDYADYISGTTMFVDGGMTLYPGFTENG